MNCDTLNYYIETEKHNKLIQNLEKFGVNCKTWNGITPLMTAAKYNNVYALNLLLEKGANPNIIDDKGRTALDWTLQTRYRKESDYRIFNRLLQENLDPTLTLLTAISMKNIDLARKMIEKGADVNYFDHYSNWAPLTLAIERDDTDMVRLLLERGADTNPNLYWMQRRMPLSVAIYKGNLDIIDVLVKKGANINHPYGSDRDPRINPSHQPNYGETPLIDAVVRNNLNVVKKLLQLGADARLKEESYGGKYTAEQRAGDPQTKALLKSFEIIQNLRENTDNYIFIIPKDLLGLIENELLL